MSEENGTVEQEARTQGWVPLDEFRGPEEHWTDAETFVKRGYEINPILRKHNKELKAELEKVRLDAKEAIEAAKEFREYQKTEFEKKRKTLETDLADLRSQRKDAISSGDGDTVDAIEQKIESVKQEVASIKTPTEPEVNTPPPPVDATLQGWLDKNDWYGVDEEVTELTNTLAASIRRKNPQLVGQEFLTALDARLVERGIKEEKKATAPTVEGGSGRGPTTTSKKSYANLPADAKAACDKFVKQKLMTQEEYVQAYDFE
jgi:ribosomal protein L29